MDPNPVDSSTSTFARIDPKSPRMRVVHTGLATSDKTIPLICYCGNEFIGDLGQYCESEIPSCGCCRNGGKLAKSFFTHVWEGMIGRTNAHDVWDTFIREEKHDAEWQTHSRRMMDYVRGIHRELLHLGQSSLRPKKLASLTEREAADLFLKEYIHEAPKTVYARSDAIFEVYRRWRADSGLSRSVLRNKTLVQALALRFPKANRVRMTVEGKRQYCYVGVRLVKIISQQLTADQHPAP